MHRSWISFEVAWKGVRMTSERLGEEQEGCPFVFAGEGAKCKVKI